MSSSPDNPGRAMAREPILRLSAAVKRYGGRTVLNVDRFEVFEDDRIELIGANASGKSTLTRILAGYGRLSAGDVERAPDLSGRAIGLLPQSGGLYRDLTLMENLVAITRLMGRKGQVHPHSERVLAELDLFDYLDRKAATLSGGIQKLGALAALISARPAGLILDEPFAGLDPAKSQIVADLIKNDAYPFRFIIVTSHKAQDLFPDSRVIQIQDGRIAQGRPPSGGPA
ncbi:MAG: ATP-binding cassette domain-containing protein [Pseudomonadota bacterium]